MANVGIARYHASKKVSRFPLKLSEMASIISPNQGACWLSDSVKLKVLYYSFQVFFALIPSVLWALDKEKAVDPLKKKKKTIPII